MQSSGTHEKYVPLILRIMFGNPLDIFKYRKAAQIRRVEIDVIELEGDLAVPQMRSCTDWPTRSHLPGPWPVALLIPLPSTPSWKKRSAPPNHG